VYATGKGGADYRTLFYETLPLMDAHLDQTLARALSLPSTSAGATRRSGPTELAVVRASLYFLPLAMCLTWLLVRHAGGRRRSSVPNRAKVDGE
jgi:hypothetical protein